jgi:hypothetical protein
MCCLSVWERERNRANRVTGEGGGEEGHASGREAWSPNT